MACIWRLALYLDSPRSVLFPGNHIHICAFTFCLYGNDSQIYILYLNVSLLYLLFTIL